MCVFVNTPRPNAISVKPLKTHVAANIPRASLKPSRGKLRAGERPTGGRTWTCAKKTRDKNDNYSGRAINKTHLKKKKKKFLVFLCWYSPDG